MQPTHHLSAAAAFFFRHAGYSWDPMTQTREAGRTACAQALAAAEALFLKAPAHIEWEHDADSAQDAEYEESCEWASVWIEDPDAGKVQLIASLYGITDADDNYRRVIRAELARECADLLTQACL